MKHCLLSRKVSAKAIHSQLQWEKLEDHQLTYLNKAPEEARVPFHS